MPPLRRLPLSGSGFDPLTHYWIRYPAKFHPPVAVELLDRYSKPGNLVLDPFCGSGSLLVEALVSGRSAIGVDIDPIAVFATKVKTRVYDVTALAESCARLYSRLESIRPDPSFYGARIAEVPIRNIQRASGGSHYGLSRTFRVMFDIFTIWFLLKYFTRPMHFFGKWGLAAAGLGGSILSVIAVKKLWTNADIFEEHGPLMLMAALALVTGVILFCTGLLGEVLTRTYFESQGRRIYAVREIRTRREEKLADGAHGGR